MNYLLLRVFAVPLYVLKLFNIFNKIYHMSYLSLSFAISHVISSDEEVSSGKGLPSVDITFAKVLQYR